MPKITHEGSNIYSATLLLQKRKGNIWIWTGKNQMQTNINEEPLILKFNEKNFYFYSTGLEKTKSTKKQNWNGRHRSKLDINQKEKIIEKLDKCIDHKDWDWKYLLFIYKNNFLKNKTKTLAEENNHLKKDNIILFGSNTSSDSEIKNLEEEINYVNQWIKNNQYEIDLLRQSIYAYYYRERRESTADLIDEKIEKIDTSIYKLIKKLSEIKKEFDSFAKILRSEFQPLTKKLKISQEKIDFNFEIGQEFINEAEKKENEGKKIDELKEFYLDIFDLEILE